MIIMFLVIGAHAIHIVMANEIGKSHTDGVGVELGYGLGFLRLESMSTQ